jgi:FMN phosphatase YigB (HAD superfamily)
MRKAVFFDLDGTLLPLGMQDFSNIYFRELKESGMAECLGQDRGMDLFFDAFQFMMGEHGLASNKEAFCQRLEKTSGVKRDVFLAEADDFYKNRFRHIRSITHEEPLVKEIISELKRKHYTLVLATNPVFPQVATNMRMEWAGLKKMDFVYVTYYENSRYVKPNLKYFEEVCKKTGFAPDECYMVGNSVKEDLCAVRLGMEVFFVKDYYEGDIAKAPNCASGSYAELLQWAKSLPDVEEKAV